MQSDESLRDGPSQRSVVQCLRRVDCAWVVGMAAPQTALPMPARRIGWDCRRTRSAGKLARATSWAGNMPSSPWPWSRPNSRTRAQADPEFARQVLRRHGDEQVGDRSIRELIATSLPCFSAVADIGLVSATGPRNLN